MPHPIPTKVTKQPEGMGVQIYGGSTTFGSGGPVYKSGTGKKVVCFGDASTHGGHVITTNTDGKLFIHALRVAVAGATHQCPIVGHGVTPITPVTVKTFHNGKLILTEGAYAGCGAVILPIDRKVYVE
jgi:uncharacterized Zn-binding protein involved in type VI secretion